MPRRLNKHGASRLCDVAAVSTAGIGRLSYPYAGACHLDELPERFGHTSRSRVGYIAGFRPSNVPGREIVSVVAKGCIRSNGFGDVVVCGVASAINNTL